MEQRFEVPLHLILDNPYQPRTTDNAEHIKSLALSIAADGLLQVPTARELNDGSYELAFGHSRRKAFEWLNLNWETEGLPNRYEGYWKMPINVEALSDEDMYACAKYLQGVATVWGLKLPADFMDVANGYQPVSAETPKKVGKKK